jgi:hypothetical protein
MVLGLGMMLLVPVAGMVVLARPDSRVRVRSTRSEG